MANYVAKTSRFLYQLEKSTAHLSRAFNLVRYVNTKKYLINSNHQSVFSIAALEKTSALKNTATQNRLLNTSKSSDSYDGRSDFKSRRSSDPFDDDDEFRSRRYSDGSDDGYVKRERFSDKFADRRNYDSARSAGRFESGENRGRDWALGANLEDRDWESVGLVRLKKNVLQPHEESKDRSKEDVIAFRKENRISFPDAKEGSVSIPNPIIEFEEAGFPQDILVKLKSFGFKRPMPIQAQGWPIVMSGRDLIGIGETGSGKTLGFILPAIMHIINHPERLESKRSSTKDPIALVLAPTRELAQQIQAVAMQFGKGKHGIRTTCLFGGANKGPQIRALEQGVDLVVATPGRLIDLLEMNVTTLHRCSYLVLDEADRMLDMGFEPQIRRVLGQIRPDRQMLMWSATWPDDVRDLADDFLDAAHSEKAEEYVRMNIGSTELQAASSITQNLEFTNKQGFRKSDRLLDLLEKTRPENASSEDSFKKVLIFAQTKKDVDFLERIIRREGYNASAIHGDKTQMQRDSVLSRFRSNRNPILVATDVAARGLDVSDIDCVINYEFPNNIEDYIHRIGRTGRAGKPGAAYTFLGEEDYKHVKELIKLLKKAGQNVPVDLEEMGDRFSTQRRERSSSNNIKSRSFGQRYNHNFIKSNKKFNLHYDE